MTEKKTQLCVTLKRGNKIISETNIDMLAKNPLWQPDIHGIKDIYLEPKVAASREVVKTIKEADWFIICPGDFYSSIIPSLLPRGIKEAIARSKAKIILVLNIVNKKGETDNYTANDFISYIEKHIGKKIDIVFCNNKKIPEKTLLGYELENKIEFKKNSKNNGNTKIHYAPFAEVTKEGFLVHNIGVLYREFKKILVN